MGLRELFILVLGLAIVAVFLRGVYVAIKARKGQLRMQLDKNIPDYDPEELTLSELPNGGARLVERSFAQVVQQNSDFAKKGKKSYGSNSNKSIPVLMDSVDDNIPERTSTIASARQSARKKHVMGRRETAAGQLKTQPLFEPTEPSDINFEAPVDTRPSSPNIENDEYDDKLAPKQVAPHDDYDDDPIANHVFVDEALETGELAPESYSAEDDEALDDEYSSYSGDDIDEDDENESLSSSDTREADDTLENASDYADEDLLEHDEDAFEDEDFVGDGPDAVENSRDQSADDLEDDDYEDEDEDDEFESDYAHDKTEHEGFSALDDDSEFEDEEDDETDLDYNDDAEDDQDFIEDDLEQDDQFDDDDEDDDYDHDYDEPTAHEKEPSGPRSWLKWAGNKISEMGGSSGEDEETVRSERAEPVIGQSSFDEVMSSAPRSQPEPQTRPERSRDESAAKTAHFDKTHQSQLDLGAPAEQPAPKPAREQKRAQDKAEPAPEKKTESTVSAEFSEVLVINVMAKTDRDIAGIDMLQVLMANGLIFGDMSIFHRHLEHNRESPVLFSVANMVNPGTFDLNQIGEFATKGLCFFLTLPNVATSMQAFEKMLDAAQQVRVALDCDLKDDSRSVMTSQTIEHYRQRVRDFDLRQLRQPK